MQEVPGSNPTSGTNSLIFTEFFQKVALHARPILKPFLKSPCQELSENVVGSSGSLIFTRLDSGEQCFINPFINFIMIKNNFINRLCCGCAIYEKYCKIDI